MQETRALTTDLVKPNNSRNRRDEFGLGYQLNKRSDRFTIEGSDSGFTQTSQTNFNTKRSTFNSFDKLANQVVIKVENQPSNNKEENKEESLQTKVRLKSNMPISSKKLKIIDGIDPGLQTVGVYKVREENGEVNYVNQYATTSCNDLLEFKLTVPQGSDVWLKGEIVESDKGFKYYINNSCLPSLTGLKIGRNDYGIYSDEQFTKLIGRVRKNMLGNIFSVTYCEEKNKEKHICTVYYNINILGLRGPIKMKIKLNSDKTPEYRNLTPKFSFEHNCYFLTFKERKIKPSVKNVQICRCNEENKKKEEEILLQFAEGKEGNYILDFKAPFSPLQAFGIGLSCIQRKLICNS